MERSSFFNSINGDRKYTASYFAEYFASFIGNGVFPNPSSNLQVLANGNMSIAIETGKAFINGYFYFNDNDLIKTIDIADGVLNRIDRVVVRWSLTDRKISIEVKKGVPSSTAIPQEVTRNTEIYELAIADICIAKGAITIKQTNITDLRLYNSVCGLVTQTVKAVDTETLGLQLQAWFEEFKAEGTNLFTEWFQNLQDILDENTAGNLLGLINDLDSNLVKHTASDITSTAGVHGLRYNSNTLQYENGEEWVDVIPVPIPINQGGTGATTPEEARAKLGLNTGFTVLWTGNCKGNTKANFEANNGGGNLITLSENLSNFDEVRIYYTANIIEVQLYGVVVLDVIENNSNIYSDLKRVVPSMTSALSAFCGVRQYQADKLNPYFEQRYDYNTGTITVQANNANFYVYKVVGVKY